MTTMRGRLSLNSRQIMLAATGLLVACLVIPPIAMVLFSSFRATEDLLPFEATSYTLANFIEVLTSEVTYRLLLNTAWFAMGTISVAMGLAILFAWFLERTNVPLRRLLFVLILSPMGIPIIIVGMAWTLLANPANGLINVVLRQVLGIAGKGPLNIYSIPGMILISALGFVPMIYIMISGVFSRIDPSFEEAGRTSGARNWIIFRRVSLPLLGPALLAAVVYFLIRAIEIFEIPAMLGMPRDIYVFSSGIYYAIHPGHGELLPNYGLASAYGTIILVTAGILIYFYGRYVRSADRFATVTGRGYRPRLIDLGHWKYIPVLIMSLYFVLAVAMPLLILLWTSLAPSFRAISLSAMHQINLRAYRQMLDYPELSVAIKNTLLIASSTAAIGMLLVTVVSWMSVRGGLTWASVPDRLAFMVIGVPGIVMGLALIFIYTAVPLPLYGTVWIIVIAHVTICLPFGTRLMGAALMQIHRELEEAAATSGAALSTTFFHIVLPLLWPSFARGFLWMFVRSLRDTTMALMLFAAGNQTLAVVLWFLWMEEAEFALAAAIAVPLVIVTMLLTLLVARQTMLVEGGS